ncbi:monooxygenase [Paraphaeosphaeria minitans]|uniref:Monooxygenase n=1 Tax=Paraphaeosphaeria minitans TaxID=565426 RepID=A0A9P6G9L3_9PLEO|nr:monooxygenase [Paraphaeosphaeria minitans]
MGNIPDPSQAQPIDPNDFDKAAIIKKYNEERDKRLRADGQSQYVDLHTLPRFKNFITDAWIERDNRPLGPTPRDGDRVEILIIGAGWSGLVYAVRLLQAGFKLEDIRIVDYAGGFGGTWYWNRYPGLSCDTESYIYMPLLEETDYVPKSKYAGGEELREHAQRIVKKFNLDKSAWLRQQVTSLDWNDNTKEWSTRLVPHLEPGNAGEPITVQSRFVILATGLTFYPHIPQVSGIESFKGPCFHTARWDYNVTGGTSAQPDMVNLKDMRVGILGTGATAVQAVPQLAKWSKELYVFQRTPSGVAPRNNKPTDPEWARTINSQKGWQRERTSNFNHYIMNSPEKPSINLIDDEWTRVPAYSAVVGTEGLDIQTPEKIQERVDELFTLDVPRQERIRKRVEETVKDPETAEKLKPWYSSWCKRPCFHDDYLPSFNQPNVKLIDTAGKGIDRITETGIVIDDQEHKIDMLILSTGYRSMWTLSPGARVNIDVKGRDGRSLDKKWQDGMSMLHGMTSHDFPNLFWPALNGSGQSSNYTFAVELGAQYVADILSYSAANKLVNKENAEEEWTQVIVSQAGAFAAMVSCTPSNVNGEGEMTTITSPEKRAKKARLSLYVHGPEAFLELVTKWRASREFIGLEIASIN